MNNFQSNILQDSHIFHDKNAALFDIFVGIPKLYRCLRINELFHHDSRICVTLFHFSEKVTLGAYSMFPLRCISSQNTIGSFGKQHLAAIPFLYDISASSNISASLNYVAIPLCTYLCLCVCSLPVNMPLVALYHSRLQPYTV